ncbi:receptor-type tyrosine-protein phosphatase kappa-like [Physella acuta]|uniref:receptor-type tyrosine-protein phosphatase kappa-like n=1 Tax=Physella acuta TaxID=109671 RepID=UPI0027DE8CD5|nr:receptor-type tyrosine-protein phosphatase kappa-like [Physella acuta]
MLVSFCLPNDKDDNPPRQLTHFQYTAWPEDGSDPCMWSMVDFEHKVFFNTLETVTLVHSGMDTTRSSVFIALHDLIRQAKLNQAVDFVDTVSRLRQDMPNTVQTYEQYMYLHHAAQAGIACTGSYTHISAIFLKVHLMGNVVNGKNNFENEFNNLFSFETQLTGDVGDVTQDPKSKNRFFIIPDKKYQPLLRVDSPGEEGYINAVTLPSLYTQTKQFLTQLPMPTTVNDFWRLVTQYNVSLIVAFKSYEKDTALAIYLPEEQGQPLQCGNIAVNVESVTTAPTWTEMKLSVKFFTM